jgi:hypothetical protein
VLFGLCIDDFSPAINTFLEKVSCSLYSFWKVLLSGNHELSAPKGKREAIIEMIQHARPKNGPLI